MKTCALTIAGSDSSGGAGIQADLRAFKAAGVHGACAITCVTAQNSSGVQATHRLPLAMISAQIDSVVADLMPTAAKIGMLYDTSTIKIVAEKIREYTLPAVVDPVMIATAGQPLIRGEYLGNIVLKESIDVRYQNYVSALKKELISQALLVMPNMFEASRLVGWPVENVGDMKRAAKTLSNLGCKYVLIKGGHLENSNSATDVLYNKEQGYKLLEGPREPIGKIHGAGCFYSAYITALLAQGLSVEKGVEGAKKIINQALREGYKIGKRNVHVLSLK